MMGLLAVATLFLVLQVVPQLNGFVVPNNSSSLESLADIKIIKQLFLDSFSKARSDGKDPQSKELLRQEVLKKFTSLGLQSIRQEFVRKERKGSNLIGIRPGKNRGVSGEIDKILVIGAHYDTVANTSGVADNGSGSVQVLELARLLQINKVSLDHTVIFVLFDLEEFGLFGSDAFVQEYLIPKELLGKQSKYLGAYIVDMDLYYSPEADTQTLPKDIEESCNPDTIRDIHDRYDTGDFHAVWMRTDIDEDLFEQVRKEWTSTRIPLRKLDAPANNLPSTFYRSDHASFWLHRHPKYNHHLPAILLTDLGPFRGILGDCYHRPCDNASLLTEDNLIFLKTMVDAVYRVIVHSPPKGIASMNVQDFQANHAAGERLDQMIQDPETKWY